MDADVPYLMSITNAPRILDQIQRAGVPEAFNRDFLTDLGFTGSQDRPMVKVLKYLGFLDASGRPQTAYREFMDHTRAKKVLAARLRVAFDDLFLSDRQAHTKSVEALRGWFKSKTGASDAVAAKMASTFKVLSQYADFSEPDYGEARRDELTAPLATARSETGQNDETSSPSTKRRELERGAAPELGFVYRIEIHLPDTQNIETFRAIFRAIREELVS